MNNRVLKQLRLKIFSLLVISFSIILFLSFSILYLSTVHTTFIENKSRLDEWTEPIGEEAPTLLTIEIDANGDIVDMESNFQLDVTQYEELVHQVLHQSPHEVEATLDDQRFMYMIRQSSGLIPIGESFEFKSSQVEAVQLDETEFLISTAYESFFSYLLRDEQVAQHYYLIFLDITQSTTELTQFLHLLMRTGAFIFVGVLLISFYFSKRVIRPIAQSMERQKQFITDASHELKTPLMIINSNYDVLMDNKTDTIENQMKWLEYMKFGADRMTNLTHRLLELAQLEQSSKELKTSSFQVDHVVEVILRSLEIKMASKEITWSTALNAPQLMTQDVEKVTQVLMILLDNAVKYTNHQGWIEVTTLQTKRQMVFTVKNSGPGIASEALSKIFDRFYRADASRNSGGRSYGLGLSIAKALVEQLGGKLKADSIEHEETTFQLTLKK